MPDFVGLQFLNKYEGGNCFAEFQDSLVENYIGRNAFFATHTTNNCESFQSLIETFIPFILIFTIFSSLSGGNKCDSEVPIN